VKWREDFAKDIYWFDIGTILPIGLAYPLNAQYWSGLGPTLTQY